MTREASLAMGAAQLGTAPRICPRGMSNKRLWLGGIRGGDLSPGGCPHVPRGVSLPERRLESSAVSELMPPARPGEMGVAGCTAGVAMEPRYW